MTQTGSSGMQGIDRRLFLHYMAASGLSVPFWLGPAGAAIGRATARNSGADAGTLASVFANPPPSAGPGAYWYWLGGNVTREGITADLEAMRGAGIWTPMLFAIGKSTDRKTNEQLADA